MAKEENGIRHGRLPALLDSVPSEEVICTTRPQTSKGPSRKAHVQSLPSDYSDVQPKNYDAEFIKQIGSKMQVPYKLGGDDTLAENRHDFLQRNGSNMMVPDRIFVAGEGQHIGMREGLRPLAFDQVPRDADYQYVGLRTPPRTITLEETFPVLESADEHKPENVSQNHNVGPNMANGSAYQAQPVPYTPRDSLNESLLLNEQDENIHVQRAVAKLTRRVKVLEEENQNRSQRDMILYIAFAGIFMKGLFGWLWGRLRN